MFKSKFPSVTLTSSKYNMQENLNQKLSNKKKAKKNSNAETFFLMTVKKSSNALMLNIINKALVPI